MTHTEITQPTAAQIADAMQQARVERALAFRIGIAAIVRFLSGEHAPQVGLKGHARPAH